MSQNNIKSWRGYIYIGLGLVFGLYRALKVVNWTAWDLFDQFIAIGMITAGVYLIMKK
jgi:hypothetical protein